MIKNKNIQEDAWYWLDQSDEIVHGPVSQFELQGALLFEKEAATLENIYVWCKGMPQWNSILNCIVLANLVKDLNRDWSKIDAPPAFVKPQKMAPVIPLNPTQDISPLRKDLQDDAEDTSFKIQIFKKEAATPKTERRTHERKKLKLKVLLTNNTNTFLSATKDISMTGVRLESKVPQDFVGEGIQILIEDSRTKKRLKLKCQGIIEENNFERIFFTDLTSEQKDVLKQFLENSEQIQNSLKKSS